MGQLDESNLSKTQKLVVAAIKQKEKLDSVMAKAGLVWAGFGLKIGLKPAVEFTVGSTDHVDLSRIKDDELESDEKKFVQALRASDQLRPSAKKHSVSFQQVKLVLSVPPSVEVEFGFMSTS